MIDRRDGIRALVLATLGALFANVEPAIASALQSGYHLASAATGLLLSFESGGSIAGGILAYAALPSFGARRSVIAACACFALSNAATTLWTSYGLLAASRSVAGIAEGALLAIAFAMIARARTPHRLFAAFGIAQTACAAAAFPLVTWLSRTHGPQGTFALFAVLGVACVFAAPSSSVDVVRAGIRGSLSGATVTGLLSIFIFFAAQTAIWPFLERMGHHRGISDQVVAAALSIGALCGLLGSIAVTALPERRAGLGTCALAGLANVIGIATIAWSAGAAMFVVGIGAFNFAWAAFAPLQLNVLKRAHAAPQTFALASTITALGFAAGPALAGVTMRGENDAAPLILGVLGTPLSLLVLLPLRGLSASAPITGTTST